MREVSYPHWAREKDYGLNPLLIEDPCPAVFEVEGYNGDEKKRN